MPLFRCTKAELQLLHASIEATLHGLGNTEARQRTWDLIEAASPGFQAEWDAIVLTTVQSLAQLHRRIGEAIEASE